MKSRDPDAGTWLTIGLVVGALAGGVIVWWLAIPGPNSAPKTMPRACEALEDDYFASLEHALAVAPLGPQLHAGRFNSTWVDVREGEGDVLYVDHDLIDKSWTPRFDQLNATFSDRFYACQTAFPDEFP